MNNVLIIGAHFDDSELGAGGTAALLSRQGKKVYKLTLTDNVTTFENNNVYVDYEKSKESSKQSSNILGIEEIEHFDVVGCNNLFYETKLMQRIESIIFEKKIDTVFIHYNHDMNYDHISASQLSMIAARHCDNILMYQSNGYAYDNVFTPTVFIDISSTIELKKQALKQYGSEHNRFGRLFENNIERNHVWGYSCHCEYAEGFVPIKYTIK